LAYCYIKKSIHFAKSNTESAKFAESAESAKSAESAESDKSAESGNRKKLKIKSCFWKRMKSFRN
jgi:hypothetical protein